MTNFYAEVIGTMLLVLLGNGVVANVVLSRTKGNNSGWMVITTGWALAVFVGVAVAAPYSGAHLNPAVTLSLALAGKFPWEQLPVFMLAQMIGAMIGAFLVSVFYGDHLADTKDQEAQLASFSTGAAIKNPWRNLLSETIGTFVLVFVIFNFAPAQMGEEKIPIGLGALGALPVALLVWSIGLSLGGTTGYAINPARDLGPRIIHFLLPIPHKGSSQWSYAWIPVVGPLLGGILASVVFSVLSF